jgi:Zn-finger nucleic acid-binding protein
VLDEHGRTTARAIAGARDAAIYQHLDVTREAEGCRGVWGDDGELTRLEVLRDLDQSRLSGAPSGVSVVGHMTRGVHARKTQYVDF